MFPPSWPWHPTTSALASLGSLDHQGMPPKPPPPGPPACGAASHWPNIGAQRWGGTAGAGGGLPALGQEDGEWGMGGWGVGDGGECRDAGAGELGTEIPARAGAGLSRAPFPSQQRPSREERACLFNSGWAGGAGGAGSRISKRPHPLLPLPGPTPYAPGRIPEPQGVRPREKSA